MAFNQFDSEFDSSVRSPVKSTYIVCSTPRSGSHFLGHLLFSTGRLGYPLEYFHPEHRKEWARLAGVSGVADTILYIQSRRTSPLGIFGVKAHFPEYSIVAEHREFNELMPNRRYILIERHDVLLQAISLVRARQTNCWISLHQGTGMPQYSFRLIQQAIREIEKQRISWATYFRSIGAAYVKVTYESLIADPEREVRIVAEHLGVSSITIDWTRVYPRKQRDCVNEEWKRRFMAEKASGQPA